MAGSERTDGAIGSVFDRLRLDGKTALVTGASGGLGARFAQTLAEAGARVVLAARRLEAMEALRDELPGAGHRCVRMDVADRASVDAAFAKLGDVGPVEIVVNNSGVAATSPALDEPDADWDRVLRVNLDGARAVSLAAARRLVEAGRPGSIINIASILGLRQGGAVTAYATSKAALIQLTKQHALEWARHRIRVNALAPGYIETDINRGFFDTEAGGALIKRLPQRRLGQAEELDGPLLLLASDAGSYITGAVLAVDGGHLTSSL